MAEKLVALGDPAGLQFEIRWPATRSTQSAESATRGELLLWVHEHLVWGAMDQNGETTPVSWSWIELLEFLSNAWPYLAHESGYPLGLKPIWPARLRDDAEERWQTVPDSIARREEEELFAFEETHDLARGVHGLFAPSVWLVREGGVMTIGTRGETFRRPLRESLDALQQFAAMIRARIADRDDDRSISAIRGWDERLALDDWSLAEIASGWPRDELKTAVGTDDAGRAFEFEPGAFRQTEILEIAGLARGFLGAEQLSVVVGLLRSLGRIETPALDDYSTHASCVIEGDSESKPYEQGYRLADWFRGRPGVVNDDGFVAVDDLVKQLGVLVEDVELGHDLLDAVGCWGPRHGPAVWINRNEKHRKHKGARRSTLAHELCHLLVDREGALPLADVVNGNTPRWVEQRADAFAAELLLPRRLATAELSPHSDIDAHVNKLVERYGVSRELTAWQIRNSGMPLSATHRARLRTMVSNPEKF